MQRHVQVQEQSDENLCASIASADEIAPVHFSLCDSARPSGEHEGATARQADDILLEMKEVKSELVHVNKLTGVLVRKEE